MNSTHGGNVFAIARSLGVLPEELLDFSASINPLGPPSGVRKAVTAAFERLGHYPDSGCTELAGSLACRHGCSPDHVCVGNGSTELIYLLPRVVAGKRALLVAPTFAEYALALRQAGWEFDRFLLSGGDGFSLDLSALGEALTREYGLLYLCNPGNPTGKLYGREEVVQLLDICRRAGTLLVVDEAFMDFCPDESIAGQVIESGAGVVLRSLTKFFAFPGLRLGYTLASSSLTARLAALRMPWSVNTLAQAAGLASLEDKEFPAQSRSFVAGERAYLQERLAALPGVRFWPGAANYLLARLEGGMAAAELQRRLLAERIVIRDCGNFKGLDGRFFRVAVRTRAENARLVTALATILP